MGIDIAQLKLTNIGMGSHSSSYIRESLLIDIQFIYTNLFNKTFPIKQVDSETFYENCVESMHLDENSETYIGWLKDYKKDFDEFPFEDFEKFNDITVDDIQKYLDDHKKDHIDYDNKILFEFTKEYGLYEDESIEEKLQDYKDTFRDILKYCKEGYTYYYINQ